jgi:hypothetical protein
MFDETEILVARQMANVRCVTGDQIVDGYDAVAFGKQAVHQMRAEKTRTASDDGNRLRTFCGHWEFLLMAAAQFCQKESQSE